MKRKRSTVARDRGRIQAMIQLRRSNATVPIPSGKRYRRHPRSSRRDGME